MNDTIQINIKQQFGELPGGRFERDGPFSGEEFRKKFLEPRFADSADDSEILILLDGVYGYPTSFLDEAFGGLARIFGPARVLKRLRFVSHDEPSLINEIKGYIEENRAA